MQGDHWASRALVAIMHPETTMLHSWEHKIKQWFTLSRHRTLWSSKWPNSHQRTLDLPCTHETRSEITWTDVDEEHSQPLVHDSASAQSQLYTKLMSRQSPLWPLVDRMPPLVEEVRKSLCYILVPACHIRSFNQPFVLYVSRDICYLSVVIQHEPHQATREVQNTQVLPSEQDWVWTKLHHSQSTLPKSHLAEQSRYNTTGSTKSRASSFISESK